MALSEPESVTPVRSSRLKAVQIDRRAVSCLRTAGVLRCFRPSATALGHNLLFVHPPRRLRRSSPLRLDRRPESQTPAL